MNPIKKYKSGDFVKAEFKDEAHPEITEWMWLRVDYADPKARIVYGWLDNESVLFGNLELGQRLAVGYDQIRDRIRAP